MRSRRDRAATRLALTLGLALAAAVATPASSIARAEDSPGDVWDERPLAVYAHASFGGPNGWLGASVEYSVLPALSFSLGGGTAPDGWTAALASQLRAPIDPTSALGIELAASIGPYQTSNCGNWDFDCTAGYAIEWDLALWANIAMFYELRFDSGFTLRAYAGSAILATRDPSACEGEPCSVDRTDATTEIVLVGVALGYAFEL